MKLFGCQLLADENIHPQVVHFLRQQGCDIVDVPALGLSHAADDVILSEAHKQHRIVLTHDRDFGRLAIAGRQSLFGIVFIRPGHLDPQFTLITLQAINAHDFDFSPPFGAARTCS